MLKDRSRTLDLGLDLPKCRLYEMNIIRRAEGTPIIVFYCVEVNHVNRSSPWVDYPRKEAEG